MTVMTRFDAMLDAAASARHDVPAYPLHVFLAGDHVDSCANIETVLSLLYGDLSASPLAHPDHDGTHGGCTISVPVESAYDDLVDQLVYAFAINEDNYGLIPPAISRYYL